MTKTFRCIFALLLAWSQTALGVWTFVPGQEGLWEQHSFFYRCSPEPLAWRQVLDERIVMQETGRLHLGYNEGIECWSLITIDNRSVGVERAFLQHGMPLTSRLDLYHLVGDELVEKRSLGMEVPFREWSVDYRQPVFDLKLEPGPNLILVRQTSKDVFLLDWKLYAPEDFYSLIVPELMLLGGFFAICFGLAVYNLIIFFVAREISHVFYFAYLSLYALAQAGILGFSKQFLFRDLGLEVNVIGIATINLALIFTIYFIYTFLDFSESRPLFRRAIHAYCILIAMSMALVIWGDLTWGARTTTTLSFLTSLLVLIVSVDTFRRRHPLATFFIIAWSLLIVGNIIQVLHLLGKVPDHPLLFGANFIGATVEAIIIAYALAHKMRFARLQEAQRRRHAYSQLEKMVYPHQIQRMKEGENLETTMPHASGEAVVICLDIIASTSSKISNLQTFLRRFFDRCQNLMSMDYDGSRLSASGFRIKEMGDGFLCSVGFPFSIPMGHSESQVAMRLAFGFLDAFDQEFGNVQSRERTYCSIGIAKGSIQGFFTVSGIRSYELFGDSIVLATRYEALRKQLPPERRGHLITLQKSFYDQLDSELQKHFEVVVLRPGQGSIRNDAEAQSFAQRIFQSGEARDILEGRNRSISLPSSA